jgi:hypothetical protein
MKAQSPKLPFGQRLGATYITLNVICASLDIFWLYVGKSPHDYFPEHLIEAFDRFMRFDQEAHMRTAIIGMQTLFDRTKGTITLDRLIRDAPLQVEKRAKLLGLLERLRPRTEKIETIRNNVFAHRNHSLTYNAVFAQAHLCRNDLEIVVRLSIKIINALAEETGNARYVRCRQARDEFIEMLTAASNFEAERIAAELSAPIEPAE